VRRRLVLSYLSLTLFVLLALGLPFGLTFANSERRRLVSDVQHDAFALSLRSDQYVHDAGTDPEQSPTIPALTRLLRRYVRTEGARVVVVDVRGSVLAE
jgi:hypothetical protein